MSKNQLHIYEEETNLLWAPVVVISAASATYILSYVFLSDVSPIWGVAQIIALLLILLSFYGILKISDPLYHFVFHLENDKLIIHANKGENHVKDIQISIREIDALKFSPNEPRSPGEALFDYSVSYHLMWKPRHDDVYRRLLDLDAASFVLKVDDIARIIRFIRLQNPEIYVPHEQASFFNL